MNTMTVNLRRYRFWNTLSLVLLISGLLVWLAPWRAGAQFRAISFGDHGKVQFVDPAGHNQVYLSLYESTGDVAFALYALSSTQFATRYNIWNPDTAPDLTDLPQAATWQTTYAEPTPGHGNASSTTLPAVDSGLYLLTATGPDGEQAATLLVYSRYALLLKQAATGQLTVWASALQSGAPQAGMDLTLHDAAGTSVAQSTTDATGVATFQVNAASLDGYVVIGTRGAETTAVGVGHEWHGTAHGSRNATGKYTAHLHTDRPLYRPGHTLHFAAILRQNVDGALALPAVDTSITATLLDPRHNTVDEQMLSADEFGTAHGSFALSAEPPLGDYVIELAVGPEESAETFRQPLRVAEYRKPEYAVEVTADQPYVIAGDDAAITVQADYFFGQPVADAAVTVTVYEQFSYPYYDGWEPYYQDIYYPPTESTPVDTFTGRTDATGRWRTTYTPAGDADYDTTYTFVASVTDAQERPVENSLSLPVYWNTFQLNARTDRYGYEAGQPVTVDLTAVDHSGDPVDGQAIDVAIRREYSDEPGQNIAQQQATTAADGTAQLTFTDIPQGWYHLVATSSDARGRKVTRSLYLWIYDPADEVWWYTSDETLSISPDRDSYAPGDTAQLLIQSRITDTLALVTLERDEVLEEIIVAIDGPITTVDVPIADAHAPNVFATVHLFRRDTKNDPYAHGEGQMIAARTELSVPVSDKRLDVRIDSNAAEYRPGDDATLTLRVTDAAGQPVRARVTLALVDEAIFALSADRSADLFETFYGRRDGYFTTYESPTQAYFYTALPVEVEDDPPVAAPTGTPARDESDSAAGSAMETRRTFLDTAYWNPTITSAADGTATVTVPLPDNLTTWRVLARAVTVDSAVGETASNLLVTQEIIARPTLPRFSVLGDRFRVGMVGQNFSGTDTTGSARMDASGLLLLDGGTQSLELPHGGADSAHWTAVASHIGTGLVTTTLDTSTGSDRIQLPLETAAFAVPQRIAAAGEASPAVVETFEMPFNAINEASELTLRLSPSIALGLLEDLDSLIDYPYGCLEQTMSRLLPSAVASKTYQELGILNPKADELPDIISQGVQKLYGEQHNNGGWGWFFDADEDLYLTAYVLFGLTMVQDIGFDVDADVLENGFAFIDSRVGQASDPGIAVYAHYVKSVAGRGDLAALQALAARQSELDAFGLAILALALYQEGDVDAAQAATNALLAQAEETASRAYWPLADERSEYHWRTMASTEKNTAAAIRALVALRGEHPILPKAVRWLMDQRQGSYYGDAGWRDTQATAFAVLGLLDYVQVSGELTAEYDYAVTLNEQPIASGRVTPQTATQPIAPIEVPGEALRLNLNELRIERSGGREQAPLYYVLVLRQELFHNGFTQTQSVDEGLSIRRAYRLIEGEPRADGAYNMGDLVEVELTVEASQEMAYVHITSPNPAGFEALSDQINAVTYSDYWTPYWSIWGYNRKEVRDDRVDFFVSHLYPGTVVYTYRMRATTAGEFSALPAQAYPMYVEEIWGRSASAQVTIAPERLSERPALVGDFDRDCRITGFDAQQVAGAWGTDHASSDIASANGGSDGAVDLYDVTTVAARRGADCLTDRGAPGTAPGQATFVVETAVQEVRVGEPFTANVRLDGAPSLGGFGVTLQFDPRLLRATGVDWNPALGDILPLGPMIDNQKGVITFGAYDVFNAPTATINGARMATVTLIGRSVGEADLAVSAQAANEAGQMISAHAQSDGSVSIDSAQNFLPWIGRP